MRRWVNSFIARRGRVGKFLIGAVTGLVLSVTAYSVYAWSLQLTGNFHEVQPQVLYRSSQPTPKQIALLHSTYGIKTIINLRGAHKGAKWYDDEVEATKRSGMNHIDYKMSAERTLTQEEAAYLISIFSQAEKPILIHCQSGADRSGLASALYLAAISKEGEEAAEEQISLRFGHIPIPYLSSAYAMDETFEDLESWLGYEGS